ncbi:winged helix-turn-helix transcriptional regulator [Curtanaerobium respiraculi]|uniref:winged helix-turn-helix transcriptional regulator n=1 Tax=Curtanaerobium respiraculi TaxID=2949669 RepID=UPI0024B35021|nr:helix-turn-helix domain-containing protein [Curtanaerobium respiraculi]
MEDCPTKYALDLLAGKWKLKCVYVLTQHESLRFNELQRQVADVSAVMLSKTLQELEADGIVARRDFGEIPPHVEYSLTEAGSGVNEALERLGEWGHCMYVSNTKRTGVAPAALAR